MGSCVVVLPAARPDLSALVRLSGGPPLTRFAPSPTGYLHLGHVVNAIYVWGVARALGGRVVLRIEDHDRVRCRAPYEAALLEDLDWLGFVPDVYRTAAFRAGPCDGRQSNRTEHYRAAADRLRAADLLYGCACTRAEMIAGARSPAGEWIHPAICRERRLPLEAALGWRVRIEPGLEQFDDLRLGPQTQDPAAQGGDLLIRDRRGNWTYQFAVTVDDWLQSIDLVVRGTDLLESTGRQIRLARMLGRQTPPRFLHHSLIMKTATQKLSKSDGDTGVRDLRARGWTREEVVEAALREARRLKA